MNGDVTAMDINCALASRYRRDGDGYWSEISVTEPNDTVLRLDGVALEVNWRGDTWISGFEVKVSRGDFLRDAKYLCYKNYVDDLTLVCPARMIDRSEVPEPVDREHPGCHATGLRTRERLPAGLDGRGHAMRGQAGDQTGPPRIGTIPVADQGSAGRHRDHRGQGRIRHGMGGGRR